MILTAHQPTYLPWLGLFHKISLADVFVSYNQVQYQVDNWNNRNKILTRYGPSWLTVPVFHKGHLESIISEITIDNKAPWKRKHWTKIQHAYSKSKYFKLYSEFFADIYSRDWEYLIDLNEFILIGLLDILNIKVKFESAKDWNFEGSKSERVLDMCVKMKAKQFIFGTHGKSYADIESFSNRGIDVYFQDYSHPKYTQVFDGFEPYMSVIDLLFNHGPNSYDIIMSENMESLNKKNR